MGQLLEKLGCSALGDACGAVEDEVLVETDGVPPTRHHRESDPRVALDVAELLVPPEVSAHDVLAVDTHPHHGDVGTPVAAHRRQVGEVAAGESFAHLVVQDGHGYAPTW